MDEQPAQRDPGECAVTTPTWRGTPVAPAAATGASMSINTPSDSAVGDLAVLIHGYDYNTLADMSAPTGTAVSTWTLRATADTGTNRMHFKVWTGPVTAAGVQTVIANSSTTNASHMPVLYIINGTSLTLTVDGAAGANGAASTSHVAPSVSPVGADDLLVCAAGHSPDFSGNYTAPTGMTKQTEVDAGAFSTVATFTQTLAASGATGTRTATYSLTEEWAAISIAIRGEAGGTTAPAENAAGTGTANQPAGTLIQFTSEASAPSAAALTPGPEVRPSPSEAAASASAPFDSGGGSISLTLISDAPVATTGVAHDPTVLIGSVAFAEAAAASAAALDAVVRITFDAGEASGTSVAYDIAPAMGVYAEGTSVLAEGFNLTAVIPAKRWRLVMPKTTDYWTVSGSLRVSIQREATVFGNDSTLYTSFDGVLSGGGDADGAIPHTTKYIWFGGHDNVTADTVIRDLWVANGFTVQEV